MIGASEDDGAANWSIPRGFAPLSASRSTATNAGIPMETSAYIPSVIALGAVLIVAGVLTLARPEIGREAAGRRRFLLVSVLATVTQAAHFIEEWQTGFAMDFPKTFGLPAIPESSFVVFNLTWIAIWLLAIPGVRRGLTIALWPLWFLGLAAVLNAVAHPILALRTGTYFPGLITAPLVGALGAVLLRELAIITTKES